MCGVAGVVDLLVPLCSSAECACQKVREKLSFDMLEAHNNDTKFV